MINESKWAKWTKTDKGYVQKKKPLGQAANIGMKLLGGATVGGFYMLCGEIADHIPVVKDVIPQAIEYITTLNVEGHLDKVSGLVGVVKGVLNSGYDLDDATLTPKKWYVSSHKQNYC